MRHDTLTGQQPISVKYIGVRSLPRVQLRHELGVAVPLSLLVPISLFKSAYLGISEGLFRYLSY